MSTVMICEDDAILAADLALTIEENGHRVSGIYANGHDALKSVEYQIPDVAFIDLELNDGHTGAGIAQELQAMGVRVIVLSGYPNVGVGLGNVPHTYAAKPMSSDLVEFLLRTPSARREAARKAEAALPNCRNVSGMMQ